MKTRSGYRKNERGAVAIIFGLTVVVLFAMGGVVLDLGHLYIAKAELQNAADAAALAGAKDLNETTAGINSAVNRAQIISAKNKYNFSTDVTLALTNIEFGPTPDGPWASVAAAQAAPQGKTFIKVDTGLKVLGTYLMRVAGVDTVSTFGLAVAGRFVNNVTPIGVCAVDPATKTARYSYPPPPDGTGLTELVEFGFRRGVTYDLFGLNPLAGGPSDPYLLNPVDSPPSACNPANSSADFTAPFLCSGTSAIVSAGSGKVYTNTGLTAPLADSLNSRFGNPKALTSGKCIAASAPPDTNIMEYPCKGTADPCVKNPKITPPPPKWMEKGADTIPNREFVALAGSKPNYQLPSSTPSVPAPSSTFAQFPDYGVLWSYGPAYQFDASSSSKAGTAFTPEQANLNPMYSTATPPAVPYFNTDTDETNLDRYPVTAGTGFPAGTPAAPYNQTSLTSPYYKSGGPSGVRNRRILNIVLVDCTVAPVGPAACGEMTAVGIGKFFMQIEADFSGGPNRQLSVEFAGLVSPVPTSVIKLYK